MAKTFRAAELPEGSVVLSGNRRLERVPDDDPHPTPVWRTREGHPYTDRDVDLLLRTGKAQVLQVGTGQEG